MRDEMNLQHVNALIIQTFKSPNVLSHYGDDVQIMYWSLVRLTPWCHGKGGIGLKYHILTHIYLLVYERLCP